MSQWHANRHSPAELSADYFLPNWFKKSLVSRDSLNIVTYTDSIESVIGTASDSSNILIRKTFFFCSARYSTNLTTKRAYCIICMLNCIDGPMTPNLLQLLR